MRELQTPTTSIEAINSRRNPCFGSTIVADMQQYTEHNSLLTETRDIILNIVDPERSIKKPPIRSTDYIKQKVLHTTFFGTKPLLDQESFLKIYSHENGLLNKDSLNNMCEILRTHIEEEKPFLEPLKIEIMKDGTILARFSYKTTSKDEFPLLKLTKALDPDKKFTSWDANNPLRYTTVVAVMCVVNLETMQHKIPEIQKELELATEKLKTLGNINIIQFKFIHSYNKRTLSEKHVFEHTNITPSPIKKF